MRMPDYDVCLERTPKKLNTPNAILARTVLQFLKYSPRKYFKKITKPIFVAPCLKDNLVPAPKTIELAYQCKTAVVKEFNHNHFNVYFDGFLKTLAKATLSF